MADDKKQKMYLKVDPDDEEGVERGIEAMMNFFVVQIAREMKEKPEVYEDKHGGLYDEARELIAQGKV